ncbi:MAG: peptidoglycan DD-metalloendopeptidase family protein [Bacteroidales bacterium]|nr:peptidoglycan DD-metalloendopeptidase family protein [Bacteroidales bacterium]
MQIRRIGCIIVCLLMWAGMANSQTKASLTKEKQKLEKEIAEQKKLLATTQKNKDASLREIQLINGQIKNQEKLILTINSEIDVLDGEIEKNTKEYNQLKAKLDLIKGGYKDAVYSAYKYRNAVNKIGFILSSGSIAQAVTRMNYLSEYSRALKKQVEIIDGLQKDIQKRQEVLEKNKNEKTQLAQSRIAEKQKLSKQEREKQRIVANLKTKEKQINEQIKKKVARQKNIDAAIKRIIDAEIAKAKAKANTTSTSPSKPTTASKGGNTLLLSREEVALSQNFESNKGKLPWPVVKGNIIEGFGTHTHREVSSVQITNNGVNILAEKSAPVRAVFNGVVSAVFDINDTKGVIVRHGNYFTVYVNLASVTVKSGQSVTTKQTIGYLTQKSGDAHAELHFELLKGQEHQNPALWILK